MGGSPQIAARYDVPTSDAGRHELERRRARVAVGAAVPRRAAGLRGALVAESDSSQLLAKKLARGMWSGVGCFLSFVN